MKSMGLFGMSIPEEFGGLGLTMEEECLVAFEFGHTSPVFRSTLGTNNGIGSQAIIMFGTPEQKKRYLPALASGEMIGSFALTEPEAGSDAGSVRTSARRVGDEYILNGTKRFITNAPKAGLFSVFARTDPNTPGGKGMSAFLVPGGLKGIEIGRPEHKMGQHGTYVSDVVFNDVHVDKSALLGGVEGQGFKAAMQVLDSAGASTSRPCASASPSGSSPIRCATPTTGSNSAKPSRSSSSFRRCWPTATPRRWRPSRWSSRRRASATAATT